MLIIGFSYPISLLPILLKIYGIQLENGKKVGGGFKSLQNVCLRSFVRLFH